MYPLNKFRAGFASLLFPGWRTRCALLILAAVPVIGSARQISVAECIEGSDFIKNAALARDGGVTEASFMARIHEDIEVLQALPPQLRWFVQDEEDAKLLISAATDVFRKPKDASAHQKDFLKACLPRVPSDFQYRL